MSDIACARTVFIPNALDSAGRRPASWPSVVTANEKEFCRRLRIAERMLLRLGSLVEEEGDDTELGRRLDRIHERLSDFHEYLGDLATAALVRGIAAQSAGIEAGAELLDQMGIPESRLTD